MSIKNTELLELLTIMMCIKWSQYPFALTAVHSYSVQSLPTYITLQLFVVFFEL